MRLGRPTNDPKTHDIRVRINDEMDKDIKEYSEKHEIKPAETVRMAISKFFNK